MKRNRVNEILSDQTARRNKIISYVCIIIIISIICLSLVGLLITKNKKYYVNYNEQSNIDYKVHLKQNDFFQTPYMEKNNQYIASLINNITADFNYQLNMDEEKDIEYKYTYRMEADVNVVEKDTKNSLYNFQEELVKEKYVNSNNNSSININDTVTINYNYYNDIIKKFVNTYELDNVESTLTINMYVDILDSCSNFEKGKNKESIISLSIPLTTKTMAIDISSNLVEGSDNVIICKKDNKFTGMIATILVLAIIILLILIFKLAKYIITTRTAESIYDIELKKILNNYRSYIQKVNNEFDLTGYQVLKVDTFTDMLEIRDTIQEPILMVESKRKTGTYFLIPSKTKVLYSYGLKVSDIKAKMKEKDKKKSKNKSIEDVEYL